MSIGRRWCWWNDKDFIRTLKLMHFGSRGGRSGWRSWIVRVVGMWVVRSSGCRLIVKNFSTCFANVLTLFVIDLGNAFQNNKRDATLRGAKERQGSCYSSGWNKMELDLYQKGALKIWMDTLKHEFAEDRRNAGKNQTAANQSCQRGWIRVSITVSGHTWQIGRTI